MSPNAMLPRLRLWHFVTCATLVTGAACSSKDQPAPRPVGSSGSSQTGEAGSSNAGAPTSSPNEGGAAGANAAGGDASDAGGGTSTESGGAGEAGGASPIPGEEPPNVGGDPGLSLDPCPSDTAPEPPSFQGLCSAEAKWGDAEPLTLETADPPSLVAITPDELSIVWSETPSSVPIYFMSDRASTDDEFVAARELPFSNVLGLSPDGLRITLRANDGRLAEASRANRDSEFGDAAPGAYATLEADAQTHQLRLADLVISPDDKALYYTAWSLQDETTYPLRVSSRTAGEEWPVGVPLEGCAFKAYGAFGPRPSGISGDGLTLFFYDDARSTARAAFRATTDAEFGWFSEFPEHLRPQPNASCDRLYYSPRSGAAAVLSAARK